MQRMISFKKSDPYRITVYGIIIGIVWAILQHQIYLLGHGLAGIIGFEPFSPKLPLDDMIPIVNIFIIPYVWAYLFWAMGPMAVSKCDKRHFADYMAANVFACLLGMIALGLLPTYMDRVAEGLYDVSENPGVLEKLRLFWYSMDGSEMAYNLLPSFHCINSTLCYLGVMGRKEIPKWFRAYSLVTALLIFASTLYVKQHFLLDVPTGIAVAVFAYFICKKFHWGRAFDPFVRIFENQKAKKAVRS